MRPRATDQFETIPAGLVFRSVGYRGVPLPDVPFFDDWGTIPNEKGRVLTEHDTGEPVVGHYTVGWIKRGPSGIIGTNKPDSIETVKMLLEDMAAGNILNAQTDPGDSEAIVNFLQARDVRYVTFADWQRLDEMERERGEAIERPRVKFSRVEEMLHALEDSNKIDMPIGGD
jgi:ferredoxin--NADP+ reductase